MAKIRAAITILSIISFLLVTYTVGIMASSFENLFQNTAINSASQALTKIRRSSDEHFALQKELNHFYGLLSEEEQINLASLEERCKKFKDAGYSFINLRFFDKHNNQLNVREYRKDDILDGAMRRLYSALTSYRADNNENNLKRYRSLFETLLGAVDLNSLAKQTSTLIPVTLSGKPGYFYWNIYEDSATANNVGGMLAWIKKSEIPSRFFCQKLVNQFNIDSAKEGRNQIFGFIDTESQGTLYPENMGDRISVFDYDELSIKLSEFKAMLISHSVVGEYLFNYIESDSGQYFFCLTERNQPIMVKSLAFCFVSILFIGVTLFCIHAYNFLKKLQVDNGMESIVRKGYMSVVFLGLSLASFIALVCFFTNSLSKNNRKALAQTNLISVIDWIDDGYLFAKKDYAMKLVSLSNEESFKNLEINTITARIKELEKEKILSKVFITTKDGEIEYSYPANSSDSLFNKIIPVAARKISAERLATEESWKNKIDSLMMDSMGKSFNDLLGEGANNFLKSFENIDSLSELELGSKRHLVFSTVIQTKQSQKILIVWLDAQQFCRDYIVNKIKESENLPGNLKQIILAMVPVKLDSPPYPPEITKHSFARDITERISYTKRPVLFETSAGGQNFYGVGTLLHSAPNYAIFALKEE